MEYRIPGACFIIAQYDSFILSCHDFYMSGTKSPWKTHHFKITCLRHYLRKPKRELIAFHVTDIRPISRMEHMEYVYSKFRNETAYKPVMSALDYYIETEKCDARIFTQITHFDQA